MTLEWNTWWQRTYNVLGNPIVRKKGWLQTKQTIWRDKNDYSYESGRQNIMMLEWFLCNNWTYNPLLEEINKDRIFNILKSGDTNDRFNALINRRSMIESAKILTDRIINDERITKENPCSILAHSNGWVIWALVRIMLDQAWQWYKISNLTTLSSATDWSKAISELPVGWFYSSLKDMAPDSDVIKAIRKDWRIFFFLANCPHAASISSHIVALIVDTIPYSSSIFWNFSMINFGVAL